MTDEKQQHFNAAGTHVLVYNPETDARWESSPEYLPIALKRGWELAEPVGEDADEEDLAGFDPSAHTAAEVNAYLAENADDSDEVARVLALEITGKDRKTISATEPTPGD